MATTTNVYKAKLVDSHFDSDKVTFDVSPEFTESRSVNYTPLEPVHAPGQIYTYRNSLSRTFDIGDAKFISRNRVEATKNLAQLQLLRSWLLPWFGDPGSSAAATGSNNSTTNEDTSSDGKTVELEKLEEESTSLKSIIEGANLSVDELKESLSELTDITGQMSKLSSSGFGVETLGAPPAVLYFSAYSSSSGDYYTNIRKVPVVISSLSFAYPTDVDYIPSAYDEPFPTVMSISMTLLESHSPVEFEGFKLKDFKQGNLEHF